MTGINVPVLDVTAIVVAVLGGSARTVDKTTSSLKVDAPYSRGRCRWPCWQGYKRLEGLGGQPLQAPASGLLWPVAGVAVQVGIALESDRRVSHRNGDGGWSPRHLFALFVLHPDQHELRCLVLVEDLSRVHVFHMAEL